MNKPSLPYDAWLIWSCLPQCNLHCHYCISLPSMQSAEPEQSDADFLQRRNSAPVAPIAIDCFLNNLNCDKKKYVVQLTGGEPLLIPNIVELCQAITQEHYLVLNTNLSTRNIDQILTASDVSHIKYIAASFHVDELEKHNLLDIFMHNSKLIVEKGIQLSIMAIGHPDTIARALVYKQQYQSLGFLFSIEPFRGYYQEKKYPLEYSSDEKQQYELYRDTDFFLHKDELCNAGYNIAIVTETGDVYPCLSKQKEKLGNIYKGFQLKKTLQYCAMDFCGCPFKMYDLGLFEKALQETSMDKE